MQNQAKIEKVISMGMEKFKKEFSCKAMKVEAGIVYGYGITCLKKDEKGIPRSYVDKLDEHLPEAFLQDLTLNYMEGDRVAKDMHTGEPIGKVVYGFPMTSELARSLKISDWDQTGFLVGMKPNDEVLEKFKTGERTGFSLGGHLIKMRNEYDKSN